MPYFNYHSNVKQKIKQSQTTKMIIADKYKDICPCLLVIIDGKQYPIREHRWQEYFDIASSIGIKIQDMRGQNDGKYCNQQ